MKTDSRVSYQNATEPAGTSEPVPRFSLNKVHVLRLPTFIAISTQSPKDQPSQLQPKQQPRGQGAQTSHSHVEGNQGG